MTTNSFGETPLIVARKNCQLNQVKYLVEEGKVDLNQKGNIYTDGQGNVL